MVDRLEGISVSAGYNNDIPGGVLRTEQEPQGVIDVPVITVWEEERRQRSESVGWTITLTIDVTFWAQQAPDDPVATHVYLDSLREDALRAIGDSITINDHLFMIEDMDEQTFPILDGNPEIGFTLSPSFTYRLDPKDPTLLR